MTITLFITMLTLGAAVCSLLTEAIKKAYTNANKPYSANVIALCNAIIVGGLGTSAMYMLKSIPFTINNCICIALMVVCVWISSEIGYDKVIQLLQQVQVVTKDKED